MWRACLKRAALKPGWLLVSLFFHSLSAHWCGTAREAGISFEGRSYELPAYIAGGLPSLSPGGRPAPVSMIVLQIGSFRRGLDPIRPPHCMQTGREGRFNQNVEINSMSLSVVLCLPGQSGNGFRTWADFWRSWPATCCLLFKRKESVLNA